MQIMKNIITNVLTALYEPFWYAVLSAVLLNFFYLYAYYPKAAGEGIRAVGKAWAKEFQTSAFFRKLFLLFFLTMMILFRTLLNRRLWLNPLSDVMGGWWIWETKNGGKQLTTECLENLILMIPFVFLLFWTFGGRVTGNVGFCRIIRRGLGIAFLFSFSIEFLQLLLRLGTWQLADLFYNTVGGGLGGALYYVYVRVRSHERKEEARERPGGAAGRRKNRT